MQVLTPSEELTALARKLKTIENYARQYYLKEKISGSSNEAAPNPSQGGEGGGQQDGGETPDPGTGGDDGGQQGGGTTPVNPDPGTGGGDTPGGGGGSNPEGDDEN